MSTINFICAGESVLTIITSDISIENITSIAIDEGYCVEDVFDENEEVTVLVTLL